MANKSPPPAKSGLSLYANLLDPENKGPGTISSAPVTYNRASEPTNEQDESAKKQQALAGKFYRPSLRFQPTKRPQLAAQKAKAKAIASKLSALSKSTAPIPQAETEAKQEAKPEEIAPQAAAAPKPKAADWITTASDDEDVNNYLAGSRQRGGRKRKKKNKELAAVAQHDWDDVYDPSRPNNYEEYKHSDEKIREVREWKDLLYRHRMNKRHSDDYDSDSDGSMGRTMNRQFAPPASMSFAPPKESDALDEPSPSPVEENDEVYVPPVASSIPDDASGEDAFARRMRMSQMQQQQPPPPPPADISMPGAMSMPLPPPPPPAGQISRAPVRYNFPPPDPDIPATEAELEARMDVDEPGYEDDPPGAEDDQPRSRRPGQAKFAERLMAKYGWSKGQGLGKEGTGVTSALYAKVDKRKKKSDAEGGGYATPTTTGRILGGSKSKAGREAEEGKFGAMSEVVRLEGMLNGIDVQQELSSGEGGIMQEIGEECAEKYGNVERVYIHAETNNDKGPLVFVRFTNQLSALRAVNALEGRIFSGNEIAARFWDKEKFDKEVYE